MMIVGIILSHLRQQTRLLTFVLSSRFLLCKHQPLLEEEAAGPEFRTKNMQRVCFESQRLALFDSLSKTMARKLDFLSSFTSITTEKQARQTDPESESWVN